MLTRFDSEKPQEIDRCDEVHKAAQKLCKQETVGRAFVALVCMYECV